MKKEGHGVKKTLEKYVLKPFLAGAFAASLFFNPLSINEPYSVLVAQSYAQEIKKDKKLEELLSRKEKINSRNELREYLEYSFELYDQERWDDCIRLNKHAIELCESHDDGWFWYVYYNIGGSYFNKGEYEESLVWMDKSENSAKKGDLYNNLSLAYYGKALAYYKLKNYEAALDNIDKSLEVYSKIGISSPECWYMKALILKDYSSTFKDVSKKKDLLGSALKSAKKAVHEYKAAVPRGNETELGAWLKYSERLESEIEVLLKGLR